jgi:hypothetical protein
VALDPTVPLNDALYAALAGNVGAAVYDIQAPQDAAFPRLTVGELIAAPDDTKADAAMEFLATFHAWSRKRTSKEAKTILGLVYQLLHRQPLAVPGFKVTWCLFDMSTTAMDPDGITHHALARYRIRIEAA